MFKAIGNQYGQTLSGLSVGTYIVEAVDSKGCLLRDSIEVLQPDSLEIDYANSTATPAIDSLNNGKIKVKAKGGTPPYKFRILEKNGTTEISTKDFAENLAIGTYMVEITDASKCMAVGFMIVEEDTTKIDDVSIGNIVSLSFSLGQNIPNPANTTTLIPISLPKDGNVIFELYSITGQLLHTKNMYFSQGDNHIEYNTSGLSSGVYFYSVKYNNQRFSKKMVIKK